MDKNKGKRRGLNVVDWAIIVIVIAGVGFAGWRYLGMRETVEPPVKSKYIAVLDNLEVSNEAFANDKIKIGDKVHEKTANAFLGTITDMEVRPSRVYGYDADGQSQESTKPNSSHLLITVEGEAQFMANGGLLINGTQYHCNKMNEVLISDSLFYLRIIEIERLENENS